MALDLSLKNRSRAKELRETESNLENEQKERPCEDAERDQFGSGSRFVFRVGGQSRSPSLYQRGLAPLIGVTDNEVFQGPQGSLQIPHPCLPYRVTSQGWGENAPDSPRGVTTRKADDIVDKKVTAATLASKSSWTWSKWKAHKRHWEETLAEPPSPSKRISPDLLRGDLYAEESCYSPSFGSSSSHASSPPVSPAFTYFTQAVGSSTPTSKSTSHAIFVNLPSDPREWSRNDVHNWLLIMRTKHNLPEIYLDRFLMNGKALCLMNIKMFCYRVPIGGKMLFRDFQERLSRAMAAPPSGGIPKLMPPPMKRPRHC